MINPRPNLFSQNKVRFFYHNTVVQSHTLRCSVGVNADDCRPRRNFEIFLQLSFLTHFRWFSKFRKRKITIKTFRILRPTLIGSIIFVDYITTFLNMIFLSYKNFHKLFQPKIRLIQFD